MTTASSTVDCCPIHQRPVEYFEEENWFFRLSRFEDRLLDWYAAHPTALKPEHRGNEAIGLIKSGSARLLDQPHLARMGHPAAVGSRARHLRLVRRPHELSRRRPGSATAPTATSDWWPVDYHLIGKDIVRQHCVYWPAMLMSGGVELPKGWAIGGWLLSGGEKMSKTSGNVVDPLDLVDDVGVDGFRYYVLADTAYGNDGDFSIEGFTSRYNSDLANNLGNLARPGRDRGGQEVRRHRHGPDPDSPLAAVAASAYRRDRRPVGRGPTEPRPRAPHGRSSTPPTATSRPTSRGRPNPAPASTP